MTPFSKIWCKGHVCGFGGGTTLGSRKKERKIAVEVKSFIGASDLTELQKAFGQYLIYEMVINETQLNRALYLAIDESAFLEVFEDDLGKLLLSKYSVQLLVFDQIKEEIIKWIP